MLKLLKTDFKKEIESTLDLIKIGIDKDLLDNNVDEALKKINKGIKSILGLDIDTVNSLSFINVIDLITKENQYNSDRYMALGELLYLQGYVYGKLKDESNQLMYYKKSMEGFFQAYLEDKLIDCKYKKDLNEVLDILEQYELKLYDNEMMFALYEVINKFDKAENVLFDMIKQSNRSEKIINKGISFYNRLKKMDNDILTKGNLPFSEIEDSLIELNSMLK